MIKIIEYHEIIDNKAVKHAVDIIFNSMQEVDNYRKQLQEKTGHEINLVRKEPASK